MAWYIPQPWGHVDFSAVLRPELQIKDGGFVDRTFIGYGAHFSGDVKPALVRLGQGLHRLVIRRRRRDGPLSQRLKLDVHGWSGQQLDRHTTTQAAGNSVIVKPVREWGGAVGYQHHWTPTLRSNIGFGIYHEDINTLRGTVCNGGGSAAARTARQAGTAGCNLNKEFINPTVNLFWNPVPFVTFALNTCMPSAQRSAIEGARRTSWRACSRSSSKPRRPDSLRRNPPASPAGFLCPPLIPVTRTGVRGAKMPRPGRFLGRQFV